MNDGSGTLLEIDIINFQSKSFADPAAEVKEDTNQQLIAEIGSGLFHQDYFSRFKISFHLSPDNKGFSMIKYWQGRKTRGRPQVTSNLPVFLPT
jgi:hypothetical protein